jgi:hypothetical protein
VDWKNAIDWASRPYGKNSCSQTVNGYWHVAWSGSAGVRAFAEKYVRQTDLRIADEQRRAETGKALRELEYDQDEKGDGDDGPPKPDDPETGD